MDLFKLLADQFDEQTISAIGQQTGADPNQVASALGTALPILLGAMAKNTASPEGAAALNNALQNDHDGSILNDLLGAVGNFQNGPGAGILKHVLGNNSGVIAQILGQSSGMSQQGAGNLLQILAPIVMGVLGQQKREQNIDENQLARILGGSHQQVMQQAPQQAGILQQILDRDGDGNSMDDIAQMGMNILGGLFRR
jgi:hypothetical protein